MTSDLYPLLTYLSMAHIPPGRIPRRAVSFLRLLGHQVTDD